MTSRRALQHTALPAGCALAAGLGLWIDTLAAPLPVLLAWCAEPATPWAAAGRHLVAMPASHVLMTAAALLHPGSLACRLGAAAGMLLAMAVAGGAVPALARATGLADTTALGLAMALAMAVVMAVPRRITPS